MIVKLTLIWPLLGAVALAQSAALFDMVYARDRLLKTGREITLAVRPLDPPGDRRTLVSGLAPSSVQSRSAR